MSMPLLAVLILVVLLWVLWLGKVASMGVSLLGGDFAISIPFISGAVSLPFFVSLFSAINIFLSYSVYKKIPIASLAIMAMTIIADTLSVILALYYILLS